MTVVAVAISDARCYPGAFKHRGHELDLLRSEGHVWVTPGSPDHQRAGTPFDPHRIPDEHSWVPLDCAWARYVHPGAAHVTATARTHVRLAQLGELRGRPMTEIRAVLGEPHALALDHRGGFARWRLSRLAPWRTLTVFFDRYGVSAGTAQQALSSLRPRQRKLTLRRLTRDLSA